jgi:late competence protein required for DNA uptake (superfamily II DNA/RNA helicase)
MNLISPNPHPFCRVCCYRCGAWHGISDVLADIAAPAGTYYCHHCAIITKSQQDGHFPIGPIQQRQLPSELSFHTPPPIQEGA